MSLTQRRKRFLLAGLVGVLVLIVVLGLYAKSVLDTALCSAAQRGDVRTVRFLLDHGVDPNARLREGHLVTPLQFAARGGHVEVARLLLDHGADVNTKASCDLTALHWAAENGDIPTIRLLLDHGADVNAIDLDFRGNALLFALENEHWEAAKLLILSGSDANGVAELGLVPLDMATGHKDLTDLLLQRGARHGGVRVHRRSGAAGGRG